MFIRVSQRGVRESDLLVRRLTASPVNASLNVLFPLIVLLIGLMGLLGFHLSISRLVYWDGVGQPLSYSTSLCLALSALGVLLLRTRLRRLLALSMMFLVAVVIGNVAMWRFPEALEYGMGAARLLIGMDEPQAFLLPLSAAMNFLLITAALLLLRSRAVFSKDLVYAGTVSFFVLALACVGLLGHVSRLANGSALGFGEVVDMSFPAALGQMMLSFSLIGLCWLGQGRHVLSAKKPLRLMVLYAVCGVFIVAVFSAALGMAPLIQFMERVDQERMLEFVTEKSRHAEDVIARVRKVTLELARDARFRLALDRYTAQRSSAEELGRRVDELFDETRDTSPNLLGSCSVIDGSDCVVAVGENLGRESWPENALVRTDTALGVPFVHQGRLLLSVSAPIWSVGMERRGTQIVMFSLDELGSTFSTGPIGRSSWDIFLAQRTAADSVRLFSYSRASGGWAERARSGPGFLNAMESVLRREHAVEEMILGQSDRQVGVAVPVSGSVLGALGIFDPGEFAGQVSAVLRRVATGVLGLVGAGCLALFLLLREMTMRVEDLQNVLRERTERLRRELESKRQTEQELGVYREQLEERVLQRGEELQSSLRKLRETERLASLGALTSGIAHEISNPVGAIMLNAQNALELSRNTKDRVKALGIYEETCRKILLHARRCSGILKGVLESSREGQANSVMGDLNVVVQGAVRLARENGEFRTLQLEIELAAELPELPINPLGVEQAVYALLKSAIERRAKRIGVHSEFSQNRVHIEVKDDGLPIPQAQLEQLSTVSRSSHDSVSQLTIANQLIAESAGVLEVATSAADGTRVRVAFALAAQPQSRPDGQEIEPARAAS